MNYATDFRQREKELRPALADFEKGKMPRQDLCNIVWKLKEIYEEKNGPLRDKIEGTRGAEFNKAFDERCRMRTAFEGAFDKYKDMALVKKVVDLTDIYPPEKIDTIVGIDKGGRQYAKLVKRFFDGIRQAKGLPKMKLLFINAHRSDSCNGTTNWNMNYKNNCLLKGKDYGKALVIDDRMMRGETQRLIARGMNILQENGVKITFQGHAYLLGADNSDDPIYDRVFDNMYENFFGKANRFLKSTNSGNEQPSLFALPDRNAQASKVFRMINSRIADVAELAIKTYLPGTD